ncbi:porin [Brucella sp. C7-11G]
MNIKSLLLGSAAALVAVSGAQAADAIVAPEPEAVEYVRVCDAYGAGYFYIPGTETCLRIHGYVRYDLKGGDNVYATTSKFAADVVESELKLTGDLKDAVAKANNIVDNVEVFTYTVVPTPTEVDPVYAEYTGDVADLPVGTEYVTREEDGRLTAGVVGGRSVKYITAGGKHANAKWFADLGADTKDRDTWQNTARFTFRTSTASETELGTLKSYAEVRADWNDGSAANANLRYGYIQLGGLRVGLDESAFVTFSGYLGDVINDDVILAGGYRTTAISYTFTGGNGFSAIIALEQGNNSDVNKGEYTDLRGVVRTSGGTIDDYTPHVVGGLKYAQGWGSIAGVAAYDARNEEWAGKVRLDVNVTDQFSVWVQGGYKSNKDHYAYAYTDANGSDRGVRVVDSFYGTWGGDWAVWGGAKFQANEKAAINVQLAYEDAKTFAATANVAYELVPGFTITPEVSYTKWDDKKSVLKGDDAWQGMIRFQRSF